MSAFIAPLIPAITCAFVAAYMAFRDIDGWGWFLFAALVLAISGKGIAA